ncbi:hypothetical protein ON010_g17744 [Phytophthora cinnamomi]|nr:hypothetical protein ON010_g17744 [Phytophthora cinnamomi]
MRHCNLSWRIATLALWALIVVTSTAQQNSPSSSLLSEELAASNSASGSAGSFSTVLEPAVGSSSLIQDESSSTSSGSGSTTSPSSSHGFDWIPASIAGLAVVLGISLYMNTRRRRSQRASTSSLPVAHRVPNAHDPQDHYVQFGCTLQVIAQPVDPQNRRHDQSLGAIEESSGSKSSTEGRTVDL